MLFSYIYTPYYEATAKIVLLPKTSVGEIISAGAEDDRVFPVSIEDINTEIELLTSDDVLRDTVKSFGAGQLGLKAEEKAL